MEYPKPKILDLSRDELKGLVCSLGEPAYHADQILSWVYQKLATSFEEMTDLPLPLRERLASKSSLSRLLPVEERVSADRQTRKVLFRLEDGNTIESAFMSYDDTGSSRERRTVCVSSQVGCLVRCPFCATGQQGFERNLSTGEIMEQVLYFMRFLNKQGAKPGRRMITNVVFMGMGEPLANYEAVWQAITMMNARYGLDLGARQITVSTAGLVPQIKRLAGEEIHVELAVSLHAANDALRNRLVPINRKYPLSQLIPACREYFEKTGRRPTFEYALFKGVNDSMEDVRELGRLLAGLNCHVNLIAGNPVCDEFTSSSAQQVRVFQKELTSCGISSTIRLSRGKDIEAGCGQLRSRWVERVVSSRQPA